MRLGCEAWDLEDKRGCNKVRLVGGGGNEDMKGEGVSPGVKVQT